MLTRSSSNLPVVSPSNPSTSNPKRRNRRRSKQPFILKESPIDTMVDQRTMAEYLRAPTEGYAEAIAVPPILAEQFELKHSLINMMTSNQFFGLEMDNPHDHICWWQFVRNKSVVSQVKSCDANSNSSSEIAELTHAVNQQISAVTIAMIAILKQFQATPPPASVKAVEETCFTYDGAHPYYQCLAAGGNTFLELRNNIQGYISAAAVNYNYGNSIYRPPGSGSLPSNSIANPKGKIKAITIQSVCVLDGPTVLTPPLFINPEEDERVEDTLTGLNLAEYIVKVPPPLCLAANGNTFPKVRDNIQGYVTAAVVNYNQGNSSYRPPNLDSTKDLHPPHTVNPLSGSTTCSSPNHFLDEFTDELALILFSLGNDDLPFDIKSDLKEIEYLLHHDPIKDMDSILKDLIDQRNLADEHTLDYPSPLLYDEYDDDLFEVDDFLLSFEYDSFLFKDFSKVEALPSTNNKDKVFNLSIRIQEYIFEVIIRVAPDKKPAISHASLILEDFDHPLYELPFFKEVPMSKTLLSFLSKNEEKVFKPGIHTSKGVHSSLMSELSHRGYEVFKIIKILKSPMRIFLFSHREDICILDVPCPHFYPP
uniref:Reverse transcriptase domain-containing protein n=1 Tax=Tanacetum cinerariifolium TaxID=118510 RepID=A0A6L2JJ04_TANCI|nr:reverse transcriptase domain-containing protein [Tanacetum cinerariifolium]